MVPPLRVASLGELGLGSRGKSRKTPENPRDKKPGPTSIKKRGDGLGGIGSGKTYHASLSVRRGDFACQVVKRCVELSGQRQAVRVAVVRRTCAAVACKLGRLRKAPRFLDCHR